MRSFGQFFVVLALAIALPSWLCHVFDYPDNVVQGTKGYDVAREQRKLEQADPDWVLIGNSMLFTRLSAPTLSEISGAKVSFLSRGGSQSAIWFLFLKKVLLASEARPKLVTVFFRDTDLTWPDFRVKGGNEKPIADLQGPMEPEWQQVLGRREGNRESLFGWFSGLLRDVFPTSDLRPMAQRQIQERAFRITRIGTRANSSVRRAELNERFSLAHLRTDLGLDASGAGEGVDNDLATAGGEAIDPGFYEDGPLVFDASAEASFLPHLIRLAKANQIQLHFHRIKRKPASNHARPDGAVMATYMRELAKYLKAEGCFFTDESGDLSLTLEMYVDGDHISSNKEIQKRYLANFWERVRPLIGPVLKHSSAKGL